MRKASMYTVSDSPTIVTASYRLRVTVCYALFSLFVLLPPAKARHGRDGSIVHLAGK